MSVQEILSQLSGNKKNPPLFYFATLFSYFGNWLIEFLNQVNAIATA